MPRAAVAVQDLLLPEVSSLSVPPPSLSLFAVTAALLLAFALCVQSSANDDRASQVEARKARFLNDRIDEWKAAGYPLVQLEGKEWKFNEIEPCWAGAHAALLLKRDPEEVAKANWFFANAPVDWEVDPDMRLCELLHSYYAFRSDPALAQPARKHLESVFAEREPPRRVFPSSWAFHATENHAMMGHVWRLLVLQMRGDKAGIDEMNRHIADFIVEHARKGWYEYYSPCYVEKEVGCLVMLREWAEDATLKKLADMMLDLLYAEHSVLNIDGVMCGPVMRAYGNEIIPGEHEVNHNSRRDRMRSGQYSEAFIVFGDAKPHFYGVLGSMCLASSGYVPDSVIQKLAVGSPERGCYELVARKPGRAFVPYRGSDHDIPADSAFNSRVYCYVTPDFILGTSQEVPGRYGLTGTRELSLYTSLVVKGSPRKTVFFECRERESSFFQHKNVLVCQNGFGEGYVATREFGRLVEKGGWILLEDDHAYVAIRPARGGWSWRKVASEYVFGEYLYFHDVDSPFVLEVARPADYGGDFSAFTADVLGNELRATQNNGIYYESCSEGKSGPSAEPFVIEMTPGQLPIVNGTTVDLAGYPTIGSPYLDSEWDSGVAKISFAGRRLILDFNKIERREEVIR